MDTQDRSNHLLEEAAQRIAEACTSAHLVETNTDRPTCLSTEIGSAWAYSRETHTSASCSATR